MNTGNSESHQHTMTGVTVGSDGGHNHGGFTYVKGYEELDTSGTNWKRKYPTTTGTIGTDGAHTHKLTGSVKAGGVHKHSVTGQTDSKTASISGTTGGRVVSISGTTGGSGSGTEHQHAFEPPYYALCFIIKV